jgi:hypothetical protein
MHETSCVNVSFKFFYINIRRILECKQSKEKDLELPQVVLAETEWSEIFATIPPIPHKLKYVSGARK